MWSERWSEKPKDVGSIPSPPTITYYSLISKAINEVEPFISIKRNGLHNAVEPI